VVASEASSAVLYSLLKLAPEVANAAAVLLLNENKEEQQRLGAEILAQNTAEGDLDFLLKLLIKNSLPPSWLGVSAGCCSTAGGGSGVAVPTTFHTS
jgi:hypothetical protein